MKKVFLGKWWHWALLIVLSGLLWQGGLLKLHVIEFNRFVLLLLGGTVSGLIALIYTTKPGEQITREELQHPVEEYGGEIQKRGS